MAGFRKAKAEQAALKMAMYGPPGSGKTFTALLIAEGLAKTMNKRIGFVDTEHGTDFYCQSVAERRVHPEAFDFDALYTRSLTEALADVKKLKFNEHGVIVIDSITHLWEAAKASYSGGKNRAGQIPMWAWSKIKAPYKELVNYLISSPFHVLILGRQGNDFQEDETTGDIKAAGYKMKAEGETPYEPHVCIRMETLKEAKKDGVPVAVVEKDRTGILAGKSIQFPTFDNIASPMLKLLGGTQAHMPTEEETAVQDSERLAQQDREKAQKSADMRAHFVARFQLASDLEKLEAIASELTPAKKKEFVASDLAVVRQEYGENRDRLNGKRRVVSNGEPEE